MSDIYKATKNKVVDTAFEKPDVYKATANKQIDQKMFVKNKMQNFVAESVPFPSGTLTPSKLNSQANKMIGGAQFQKQQTGLLVDDDLKRFRYDNLKLDTLRADISKAGDAVKTAYSGWQDKKSMEGLKPVIENAYNRLKMLDSYNADYGDGSVNVSEQLKAYKSILDEWDEMAETYGKYDNAVEYNKAIKSYNKTVENNNKDLNLYDKEIKELENIIKTAGKLQSAIPTNPHPNDSEGTKLAQERYNEFVKYMQASGYKSFDEMQEALKKLKLNKNLAKRYQALKSLSSILDKTSESYDKSASKYIKKGKETDFRKIGKEYTIDYVNEEGIDTGTTYVIDDLRAAAIAMAEYNGTPKAITNSDNYRNVKKYRHLKENEFELFAYYLGKDMETGGNQAREYLDKMDETLKTRMGTETYGKYLKDNALLETLYAVPVGLDQFASGVTNLFNTEDDYIPMSSTQVAGQLAREDLGNIGFKLPKWLGGSSITQSIYDLTSTTSNMAPSILASAVANYVVPGSGAYVGGVLMGASAGGNAYQEALNNGFDKTQARTYSTLVGVSEAALSTLLSKAMGGKALEGKLEEAIKSIDNKLLKFAANYGAAFVSEGAEEGLQEILTPVFENIALGYNKNGFEDIEWGEVAYSALLGGLSGGNFEVIGSVANRIKGVNYVKKTYNTSDKVLNLLNLGLSLPKASNVNMLAQKYNDISKKDGKISSNKVYNLLLATENYVSDALTQLGESGSVAAISSAVVKKLSGVELSVSEIELLSKSAHGQEVINTIVPKAQSVEADVQNNISGDVNENVGLSAADTQVPANFMPENESVSSVDASDSSLQERSPENSKTVDVNSLLYEKKKRSRRHTTAQEQNLIKRVANSLGVQVEFTHITADLLRSYGYDFKDGDVLPDGYFDNDTNTVHIGYTVYNPVAFIFKHELTHFGERTEQYKKFVEAVKRSEVFKNWLKKKTDLETDSVGALVGAYRELVISKGYLTSEKIGEIDSEMFADFVGDCLFTEDSSMLKNMLSDLDYKERNAVIQYILDFLSYLKKKLAGNKEIVFEISRLEDNFNRMISEAVEAKKETPTENGGDLQFSISETFKKHYDSWDKKNPRIRFEIGTTSTVLQSLGVPNRKIFWDSSKIIKIQSNHSEMVDSVIKQVPEILENPIVVMESKTKENRLTMFGEVYVDNKPILAILELNPTDRAGIELDELKIASAYLKENAQNLLDKSVILYVDKNKKRVSEWEKRTRLQLPVGDSLTNSNNSISNNQLSVNQNHKSNLQFSFASVQDESLIKKAEKMEMKLITEGKGDSITRLRIWKKFGIVRDGGGKWVYEIDDSLMEFIPLRERITEKPELLELYNLERTKYLSEAQKYRREALRNKYKYIILKTGKLQDFVKHPVLFEAFPQLKEINFSICVLEGERNAYFDKKNNTIGIDWKKILDIQKAEAGEINRRSIGENPYDSIRKSIIHEIQHALQEYENREPGASAEYWALRFSRGNLLAAEYDPEIAIRAQEAYRRTKGEVEARVTSERVNMTEEERRQQMPWFYWGETISAKEPALARNYENSAQNDVMYMSAVEAGDTKALREMVDDAAASKGYTERLYHQTGADFNEFNTKNELAGKYDWELPTGVFLKPSDEDIGLKGKKQMELFAKMQNPLHFKDRAEARKYWNENVKGYKEASNSIISLDKEYQQKHDEAIDNTRHYLKKWRRDNPDVDSREIYKDSKYLQLNDIVDSIADEWEAENDKASIKAKRLINDFIDESGYDGIVIERDDDGKNRYTKSYIVFSPEQLKSAEPIVYDDSGDVIALSQRFNENKKDLRFSFPSETFKLLDMYDEGEITYEEKVEKVDNLWGEANDTFGMLPQGERAKAPIATPAAVADDKPTERFTRTIIETGKLTEEMLQGMQEKVLLGNFSYKVISDERAMDKADKAVKNGIAEEIWEETVNSSRISKNQIAIGERLLSDAIEKGDKKRVLELAAELADIFTRAGQVVQAARLLKKMTGVGRLVTAQRMVKTINKDLRTKYGEDFPPVKIDSNLAKQLAEAKVDKDIETVYDDILQDVASQVPATFIDKWNAWRYFAMLSNPITHIRNLVGNAIFVPATRIRYWMAVAGERTLSQDKRTKSLVIKKEYRDFAKKDAKNSEVINFLKGNKYNDKSALREKQRIFKSKLLEYLTSFNSNALEAEDMLFKNMHYIHALAGFLQARNINLENISQDMLDEARIYAVEEAKKATFNDESALANSIQKLSNKNLLANVLVEGVLPFKRTPINIVKRGVEYSPIGLTKTLTKGLYDVKKGKITVTEFIDGLAAGLTGTGIMLVGMLLANLGFVTGGEKDDDESQFEKWLGKQEYAVEILGKSYTVDWAAPANIPFFIGVEIVNTVNEGEEFSFSQLSNAVWNSLEPITNLSMLSGMQGVIESARYAKPSQTIAAIAGDAATSYIMQPIPSLAGAFARTIDPKQRSWYNDKNDKWLDATAQGIKNNIQSKVPGLSYTQIPKIDMWGREVSRGKLGERVLENFISPGYYSKIGYNEVEEELKRIFNKTDIDVFPNLAEKSFEIDGKTKYLTAKEYVTYAKNKGVYSFDYLSEFMEHSSYEKLTDEEKADVIDGLYEYSNAKAKTTVSNYDLMKRYKTVTNWERNGSSAVDYYIYRAISK